MGWSIGYNTTWNRDIGYGVPAICDHPECSKEIDRGLSYVCADQEPYGGDAGCGLYFCGDHQVNSKQQCERCESGKEPFDPKPDTTEWIQHKLTHHSWQQWRDENPDEVLKIDTILNQ